MASTEAKNADPLSGLPSAKDLMKQIALREAEKASAAVHEQTAAEAEKQALLERFSKPSGVSNEERLARATAIIKRAANNGLTEVEVIRFPNQLCIDRGRAINQMEAAWENTLTGLPKELGSGLIKSTIREQRQGRQRPSNFAPACRSGLRCA